MKSPTLEQEMAMSHEEYMDHRSRQHRSVMLKLKLAVILQCVALAFSLTSLAIRLSR